jgi:hypothetical protein
MPKFTLTADHYDSSGGVLIPAGTVVGDGTPYPWPGAVSMQMDGADDEGRRLVEEHQSTRVNPITGLRVAPDRSRFGSELAADNPGAGGYPAPGPTAPTVNNPVFRTRADALQPIIPAPSEHVQPGPGGRPDPMRSPEEREEARDAAIDSAAAGGPGRAAGVPAGGLGGADTRRLVPEQDRTQRVTDGEPPDTQVRHPAATPLPGQPGEGGPKASALSPKQPPAGSAEAADAKAAADKKASDKK